MALKRTPRKRRHRTRLPITAQPRTPSITWTAGTTSTDTILMSLSQAANLNLQVGEVVPDGITLSGNTLTAATMLDPLHLQLTAAQAPGSGTLTVAPDGPDVRGQSGGVLAAGAHIF